MSLRVAIVTDEPGWHGRQLRRAFAERGVTSGYVSLHEARIELGHSTRVVLPGFEDRLPDALFVRGVPGGSLAQIVFHLNVLHALRELGVPVYNDGRAIERSVDKCLTSLRLQRAGLPTPDTWVCTDRDAALQVVAEQASAASPLVSKPLFGSQGNGICLVRCGADLPDADSVDNVWYLQRFVGERLDTATDFRVFVVDGVAVAAMRRSAPGLLANVAQGGQCHAAVAEGELKRLAEGAVASLQMAYAGVDLMRDAGGNWWLIEVNSIPAWRGLQGVSPIDIAGCLAEHLLRSCPAQRFSGVAQ